jgi:hypothetical protein
MQEHLGVTLGREHTTEAPQLVSELDVVVDLTVDDEAPGAQRKRLVRALVQVDDREPPESQTGARADIAR